MSVFFFILSLIVFILITIKMLFFVYFSCIFDIRYHMVELYNILFIKTSVLLTYLLWILLYQRIILYL
jgi:hypothetical protein